MKLKMGLLSLTAASVLTVSPVLAEQAAENEELAPITRAQTQRTPSEQNQFDPLTRAEDEEIGQAEDEELGADDDFAAQDDETASGTQSTLDEEQGELESAAQEQTTMETRRRVLPENDQTAVGGGAAGGADEAAVGDDAELGTQLEGENEELAPITRAQTQRTPSEQNQFDPLTRAEDEPIGEDQAAMEEQDPLQRDRDQATSELQQQTEEEKSAVLIVPVEPAGGGQAGGSATQQYDRQTIEKVQEALNDRGFHAGHVDGIAGVKTQEALRNFQQDQGMQASGQLNEETLSALEVEAQPTGGGQAMGGGQQEQSASDARAPNER
jgi:peptidoglycan hydrolase-like protein with peptidoglycan-binding domain